MCLLSDRDIVRQLLPRAVDVKTRLINNEQLQIDINTKSMILECKNVNTLLFLLTCLLENDNS